MKAKLSRTKSILFLSLIAFFERLSFYGMRAILILYAIDTNGLNLNQEDSTSYYSIFTILLVLLPLPLGLITDLTIKQSKAVIIGSITSIIGYLLLITNYFYLVGLGLLLIIIGTSLVSPSISILIGRLFEKSEDKRNLAFLISFISINIGALLSTLAVGYIGENFGWIYGFSIACFSIMIYSVIFFLIKDRLVFKEINIFPKNEENTTQILDSKFVNLYLNNNVTNIIFLIFILNIIFWSLQEISSGYFFEIIRKTGDIVFMDLIIPKSFIISMDAIMLFPVMLVFFFIWYFKGIGNSMLKISFSMILLGCGGLMFSFIDIVPANEIALFSFLPFLIFAIAEILISPISISYITRLSDINYSSTIYALFILVTYLGQKGFEMINLELTKRNLIILSIAVFCIGFLMILSRKRMLKLTNGIN